MPLQFDEVTDLWHGDGSLREVYVHDTGPLHWERFDGLLGNYRLSYRFDGIALPFPGSRQLLANRDGSHLLSVFLHTVSLNCHFFIADQLELDIDPREILGQAEHNAAIAFIGALAHALKLPAHLTPEDGETRPFATYDPAAASWQIR